ncbi:hypothetical protein [Mesorhizobium sp. CN2-181]|uniref:hypothetical protein n=1 Tax=Mesorhizobium yinganensis TaxID=3157707 RepID=UPI0032B7C038
MGLDSYFQVNGEPITDDRLKEISLCGGMLSGNGCDGSFRGKVYDPFIGEITGGNVSLYVKEQDVGDYSEVPVAIGKFLEENPDKEQFEFNYQLDRKEIQDLKILFEVAVDLKAKLFGWW